MILSKEQKYYISNLDMAMKEIMDFKEKQDTLFVFLTGLDQKPVLCNTDGSVMFRILERKYFDATVNNGEEYYLSCSIDEIKLEDEIGSNKDKIDLIKKSVSDYMCYPIADFTENKWLKSLLSFNIITELEFYQCANVLKFCANKMKNNVQTIKELLMKYSSKPQQEQQKGKGKGGKTEGMLIDVFLVIDKFNEVVECAKGFSEIGSLIRYFYELIKQGIISDYPTAGALEEYNIHVDSEKYKRTASYWRRKE